MTNFSVNFHGQARTANVSLQDFRSMVNYDNTKNKGYVRMKLGSDGKVVLEKINNKVDVPLCFRKDMKAPDNMAIRDLFSKALGNDLKYAGASAKEGLAALLQKDSEKALSRINLRDFFRKFDREFNTKHGRVNILRNFAEHVRTALRLPPDVSDTEIFTTHLRIDKLGLASLDEFVEVRADKEIKKNETVGGTDQINVHEQMVKSEDDFRTLIAQLENRLNVAAQYVKLGDGMKSIAASRMAMGSGGLMALSAEEEGKLRAALKNIAQEEGCSNLDGNIDGTFGTSGGLTELFLKKIVPVFLRQGMENVQAIAGNRDAKDPQRLQAMEDNFGADSILECYRDFLAGGDAIIHHKNDLEVISDDDKKNLIRQMGGGDEQAAHFMKNLKTDLTLLSNMNSKEANRVASEAATFFDSFRTEAKLDNYAIKYILKHFAAQRATVKTTEVEAQDVAKEFTQKVVTAAQIQYGTRNVKGTKNDSAGEFMENMLSVVLPTVANRVKGGMPLYERLVSRTLPRYMERIVGEAVDKGGSPVFFTRTDYKKEELQFTALVKAEETFRNEKLERLVSRALKGFDKQLTSTIRRFKITDGDLKARLLKQSALFRKRMEEAVEGLLDKFYDRSPDFNVDSVEQVDDVIDSLMKELLDGFENEKNAALEELNGRTNCLLLGHVRGETAKEVKKLADVEGNVERYLQAHEGLRQKCGPEVADTLQRLYTSCLSKMMGKTSVKDFRIPANFVETFNKAIEKEFKDFEDHYDAFDKGLTEMLDTRTTQMLDRYLDPKHPEMVHPRFGNDYGTLSVEDRKALVASLVKDLQDSMKPTLDSLRKDFVLHPESHAKTDFDAIFARLGNDCSSKGYNQSLCGIFDKRKAVLKGWITQSIKTDDDLSTWVNLPKDAFKTKDGLKNAHKLLFRSQLQLSAFKVMDSDLKLKISGFHLHKDALDTVTDADVAEELKNLATSVGNHLMERLEKMPLLYGNVTDNDSTRLQFDAQIAREMKQDAEQLFKDYSDFRGKYLEGARAMCEKYGALTQDIVQLVVLEELKALSVNPRQLPDQKAAMAALDKKLSTIEKKIIAKQEAEAQEAKRVRTEAYMNTMKTYTSALNNGVDKLKSAGADDSDIAYFNKELIPVMKDSMSCRINLSPEEYLNEEGIANAHEEAKQAITDMCDCMKEFDLSMDGNLESLAGKNGFRRYLENDKTRPLVMEAMRQWADTDDVKELMASCRRAVMTTAAYGNLRVDRNTLQAKEALNNLRESVKAELRKFITERKIAKLTEEDMPVAKAIYEDWLSQFNLPDTTFKVDGRGDVTLKQMAHELFDKRVEEMKGIWKADPYAEMELLDAGFVKKFLNEVNTHGIAVMLNNKSADFFDTKLKELTSAAENQQLFNSDANDRTKMQNVHSDARTNIMTMNYLGLINAVNSQVLEAVCRIKDAFGSVESLARWEAEINGIYSEQFDKVVNHAIAISRSRVEMQEQLPGMDSKLQGICDEALTAFFGVDIRSFDFKGAARLSGTSPMVLRRMLMEDIAPKVFQETKDELMKMLMDNSVNGYTLNDALFPTDGPQSKALSGKFREKMESVLVAMGTNRKGSQYKLIQTMQKEIKAYLDANPGSKV